MWEFWRSRSKLRKRDKSGSDLASLDRSSSDVNGPKVSGQVNFKDLTISGDDDEVDEPSDEEATGGTSEAVDGLRQSSMTSQYSGMVGRLKSHRLPEKNQLIIIMVGLPGRGKTFLCNKLKCYLNWLGHDTKHINVGSFRRLQKGDDEVQDAAFFDNSNPAGMEARNRALLAALDDMKAYLATDKGQVAILDATNSTEERRQFLVSHFHGRYQYLFIESSCTDERVLEQNYMAKMMYSPDYKDSESAHKALEDFKERIRRYEEVYHTLTNRNQHYIKLIDMVTGHGYMDVNRISGYIPGKIVFYLMQVCKAGLMQARKIWLTRHGQSVGNTLGQIGGDSPLSPLGEEFASQLPELLVNRLPECTDGSSVSVSCWTSTLKRTIQTASWLPFPKLRWKALDEIHAGICDGLTYAEVEEKYPAEFAARAHDKLRYRYPSGESYLDVVQRLEPVIIEVERERESVCIVAHQAVLRAIVGYFMATPLADIPSLDVPLNTIIELRPRPDGTMEVEHIKVNVNKPGGEEDESSREASFSTMAPSGGSSRPGSFVALNKLAHQVPFGATAVTASMPIPATIDVSMGSFAAPPSAAATPDAAWVMGPSRFVPMEATYKNTGGTGTGTTPRHTPGGGTPMNPTNGSGTPVSRNLSCDALLANAVAASLAASGLTDASEAANEAAAGASGPMPAAASAVGSAEGRRKSVEGRRSSAEGRTSATSLSAQHLEAVQLVAQRLAQREGEDVA